LKVPFFGYRQHLSPPLRINETGFKSLSLTVKSILSFFTLKVSATVNRRKTNDRRVTYPFRRRILSLLRSILEKAVFSPRAVLKAIILPDNLPPAAPKANRGLQRTSILPE